MSLYTELTPPEAETGVEAGAWCNHVSSSQSVIIVFITLQNQSAPSQIAAGIARQPRQAYSTHPTYDFYSFLFTSVT
jgi:hypothetical protein